MAVTEEGKGHILYNDICGMEWGGVDIRNGGNPVVTNNWIREGHADGIVIGEGGKGVIMDNDIRGNSLINLLTVQSNLQLRPGLIFWVITYGRFNGIQVSSVYYSKVPIQLH